MKKKNIKPTEQAESTHPPGEYLANLASTDLILDFTLIKKNVIN